MKKNKYLFTFVVPAYNAQRHLNTSLPSLLNLRLKSIDIFKLYEVIIVNDGSTDETLKVAKKYQKKWNAIQPDMVKIIDKENGQYGSTVNAGLAIAQGKYFKILDADDWFSVESLIDVIYTVQGFDEDVDIVFTNHIYEKISVNKRITNSLKYYFEPNKIISLEKVTFPSDIITMHSIIYRTGLLKEIKYHQLEKYYYTDSLYALIPLLHAKNMFYISIPLYSYYIGREDQSININVMLKNRPHQLRILEELLARINIDKIKYKSVKKYTLLCIKRLIQWQFMLIILDTTVKNKYQEIKKLSNHIQNIQKENNNKFMSGIFFRIIKLTRAHGAKTYLKIGIKIYSKYKLNILDNW